MQELQLLLEEKLMIRYSFEFAGCQCVNCIY